jgi:predicted ATPase
MQTRSQLRRINPTATFDETIQELIQNYSNIMTMQIVNEKFRVNLEFEFLQDNTLEVYKKINNDLVPLHEYLIIRDETILHDTEEGLILKLFNDLSKFKPILIKKLSEFKVGKELVCKEYNILRIA